jgi:hypothetical protein
MIIEPHYIAYTYKQRSILHIEEAFFKNISEISFFITKPDECLKVATKSFHILPVDHIYDIFYYC